MTSYYQIRKNINWRKEEGVCMLLDPTTRKLQVYDTNVSDSVSNEGVIRESNIDRKFLLFLKQHKIIRKLQKTPAHGDYSLKQLSAPLNVTIQVTDRCNLLCAHCHRDTKNTSTMSLPMFKKIVTELRKLHVFNVNISGGEPLLIPELPQMIAFVSQQGMRVTMSTNGILFTEKLVNQVYDVGLRHVHISLDSHLPNKHDAMRGIQGACNRMIQNLPLLQKNGILFTLVTTLIAQSPREYGKTIDRAYLLGASAHKTNTLIPSCPSQAQQANYLQNPAAILPYMAVWKKKRKEFAGKMNVLAETMFAIQIGQDVICPTEAPPIFQHGCPAALLTCSVTQKGDVLPCPFFSGVILGNISKSSFSKIWESSLAMKFRNRKMILVCGTCTDKDSCGGCRARSFGMFGKQKREDSVCFIYNAA